MRTFASLLFLATAACTTSELDPTLLGTWQRTNDAGDVVERMQFDELGGFVATSADDPEHPAGELWDMREVRGTYTVDNDILHLSGRTVGGALVELDFSYYADDASFVRGAFLEYTDENADDPVRHFHAYHRRVFTGSEQVPRITNRTLDASLEITEAGESRWWGVAYTDPLWGGANGDGGTWLPVDGGAMVLAREGSDQLYQGFGDGTVLGRRDRRAATIDAPANLWDTAFVFTR
jgi:hypothetical protein